MSLLAPGQPAGDACLKTIAEVLRDCVRRPQDLVARYGGEEFAIIFPDTGVNSAIEVAETIHSSVAALTIEHSQSAHGHVTLSIGIASTEAPGRDSPAQLIEAADAALYDVKRRGRNRTCS